MKKYIVVAGNIGVGKSTLVQLLCQRLGWQPYFEPVAQNPYLSDFYQDMAAWSFQSQVFFLSHRLRIHLDLSHASGSVMQDRSVYEDAEVFALNLHLQGYLNQRDYDTYRALYLTLAEFLPPPDLVVYLRASVPTLLHRISQRDRSYERTISPEYFKPIEMLYTKTGLKVLHFAQS